MLRGGKSGPAIVPGKPEESPVIKRTRSGQMPPRDRLVEASVKPIEPAEIAVLATWGLKMRCLLTAFEPFDGTPWNASLEGCRAFLAARERGGGPAGLDLHFEVLPVEYGADTVAVEHALAAFTREGGPPDVILHTGQAAGAREVRVERLAVNVRYAMCWYAALARQACSLRNTCATCWASTAC